jgi:hypothetical protein
MAPHLPLFPSGGEKEPAMSDNKQVQKKRMIPLPVDFDLDDEPEPVKVKPIAPEFEPTYEDDEEGNAVIGLLAGKLSDLPLKSR